jgi:hypothetical protein
MGAIPYRFRTTRETIVTILNKVYGLEIEDFQEIESYLIIMTPSGLQHMTEYNDNWYLIEDLDKIVKESQKID